LNQGIRFGRDRGEPVHAIVHGLLGQVVTEDVELFLVVIDYYDSPKAIVIAEAIWAVTKPSIDDRIEITSRLSAGNVTEVQDLAHEGEGPTAYLSGLIIFRTDADDRQPYVADCSALCFHGRLPHAAMA
jgi:hypothetical protein